MSHSNTKQPKAIRFLFENSLFLIGGALVALIWANTDADSYHHFIHFDLTALFVDMPADHGDGHGEAHEGDLEDGHKADDHSQDHGDTDAHPDDSKADDVGESTDEGDHSAGAGEAGGHHGITIHFLINDILMALFFAIAAKEVWESLLPGGALSNPRRAATPLMATLGGVVGPAGVFLAGAAMLGQWDQLSRGWAIPCATDIAFSYLIARIIFGVGHPAIAFLLLLAIADDALGLVILAVAYPNPSKEILPAWLLLAVVAILLGYVLRRFKLHSFWWYLLVPGAMSWFAFYQAGLHPALGLVPVIPAMPNAHTDLGIFARAELNRDDTLNAFEHWWKNPVEIILGLFGLVNAGVEFNAVGPGTWLVLVGLLAGKPLGITLMTWIAEKLFGLEVPAGMGYRHIFISGMIAAIGFTVALFMSSAAFPPGSVQDSVKMGALMSLGAALLAIIFAKILRIEPLKDK